MKSINVLYCVDYGKTGREWLEYSIDSLLRATNNTCTVNIFVASDAQYDREGVVWIDARPYVSRFHLAEISKIKKEGRTPSPMQIFRIVAPWVKELENQERLLYIDIDTEIVSNKIKDVYESPMDDIDVRALIEHSKHGDESTNIMLSNPELYSLMSDHTRIRLKSGGYFNSGVMLMNLARLRSRHKDYDAWIVNVVHQAVRHHRKVVDQDICNVVLDCEAINPLSNVMPDTDVKIPTGNPIIIHYANSAKYKTDTYPPIEVRRKICPFVNTDYTPPPKKIKSDDITIPWEKYFDKIYCLFYLPHKNRLARLQSELQRVDLLNSSIFSFKFMVPQKMEEIILMASKKVTGGCNRLFAVGLGMENIRAMKESMLLGHKRIMIIEDDIAFLKNKGRILEILDSMPSKFGVIQMDKAVREKELPLYMNLITKRRVNEFYIDSNEHIFDLSTCNVYTDKGMERVVDEMEKRMGIIDNISKYITNEPALAIENLAIQVVYGDCHTTDFYTKASAFHGFYKSQGIDYEKYGVPEGYSYGSVL